MPDETKKPSPTRPPETPENGDRKPRSHSDPVDEAVDESFPASDPPSHTPTGGAQADDRPKEPEA